MGRGGLRAEEGLLLVGGRDGRDEADEEECKEQMHVVSNGSLLHPGTNCVLFSSDYNIFN